MAIEFGDGGYSTFLETLEDLQTRVPVENEHQRLTRLVESMPVEEVQRRFVRLLEAVNPKTDCVCSDLSEVEKGSEIRCAYHTSRVGWIVHNARQLDPLQEI